MGRAYRRAPIILAQLNLRRKGKEGIGLQNGKRIVAAFALATLLSITVPLPAAAALEAERLVPGGFAVGIELETDGVMVAGMADVETSNGKMRPASEAGLRSGDIIRSIDGREIRNAAEFLTVMEGADGTPLTVKAERDGQETSFTVTPVQNQEGAYQIGLWLRDGISGIGTVTFYDPDSGTFGALGHGINDVENGTLLTLDHGNITQAEVVDVIRGVSGSPGELCGQFDPELVLGVLEKNTDCGLFGSAALEDLGSSIPVANEDEVCLGPALIRSNVSGNTVKDYSVEISRIYRDPEDNRFLMITVTDEELLQCTGGIVQGMSGSPILQNGKLVGAVTHVLLNDPQRGYGISIERMMKAA